ncbi:hypothetical protein [Thalassobellus suaedae]|uniref:O-antigen ligase n=1 Tax=Thalassobellus suaedae TaxID=3074124 RepID=A0ABY9XRP9_9FLAO|nr:hypothetical protein RHP51_16095 [Flavobacteriaceae bacterium HL-DH14]
MNIKNLLIPNNWKIREGLLCLISVTLLFKLNYGNIAIIIAIIYNIFFFERKNLNKFKTIAFIFPAVLFVITVLSSILSKDYIKGLKHTDLELLALLILIIIINHKIEKQIITKIFICFYYASVLSTIILLFNFVLRLSSGKTVEDIIFHDFTVLYDQHPVYFGMFLSLSLFSKIFFQKVNKIKFLYFFLNCILVLGIILCSSKVLLVFNSIFYLIYFYFKIKSKEKKFFYLILTLSLVFGIFKISFINKRFKEGLVFNSKMFYFEPTNDFSKKTTFSYEDKINISDLELRYIFGKIGLFHLVKDNKLWFGYGQGDVQNYLDYYFMSYNLAPNWYEKFNIHNQYLHVLITYGLFTLLFFLFYLFYCLYIAIKHKDILYLFFLGMTLIVFIFEVVLVRNKGIVFFYFFNTLFLFKYINFENRNIRY